VPKIARSPLPYTAWEDHQAGLYALTYQDDQVRVAQELLSDKERLRIAMQTATDQWPNAALHQLSNPDLNRRAWLGQAACMINNLVPANATKVAWSRLTDAQRRDANHAADLVIYAWEQANAVIPDATQLGLFDEGGSDA
jgi:hypothetical protein